jgi:hypothetical protein
MDVCSAKFEFIYFRNFIAHKTMPPLNMNASFSLKPSGDYMYHLLQQSETEHFYVWVLCDSDYKQRIFSLNIIKQVILVTVKCVFFAVRTKFLHII